jgi:ABC-type histidine transport system ATPase subunit
MLFDEPTSALDLELVGGVPRVRRALQKSGIAMVVVTHEVGFARITAHRMLSLDHGLVEEGPPAQIFGEARA